MKFWQKDPEPAALVRVTPMDRLANLALDALVSERTKQAYRANLREFCAWFDAQPEPLCRRTVMSWKAYQQTLGVSNATVNQRLSSVRKLVREAANNQYLDEATAAGILRIDALPAKGGGFGNWLTAEQLKTLLDDVAKGGEMVDKRDRVLFALLVGAWLRRDEAVRVTADQIQERDGRPVIYDHLRKRMKRQTVPLAGWAARWIREWLPLIGNEGPLLRKIDQFGRICVQRHWRQLSPAGVWAIVHRRTSALGFKISPHDLRRTCAKLARGKEVALEKIQEQLGHSSITTTMLYVGAVEGMGDSACDHVADFGPNE